MYFNPQQKPASEKERAFYLGNCEIHPPRLLAAEELIIVRNTEKHLCVFLIFMLQCGVARGGVSY